MRFPYLASLAKDGLSATQIARLLGVTKNVIIGLCTRRGIQLMGKPGPIVDSAPTSLPDFPNDPPLAGSTPTPLVSTTGCRWPVEGGFCNHAILSKSYCETHHAKAYRPVQTVHPLLTLLATKGPQTPPTYVEGRAYNALVRERLVMFRRGPSGLCTYYLTDAGRAML